MPIEKRPANPLPKGPRPGSRYPPYKVTDADSLEIVAQKFSVSVSTLIMHNFATMDPPEINWYLRENVGCNKPTSDGKNWCFSNSASPGLMYLPALGTRKPPTEEPSEPEEPPTPGDIESQDWSAANLGAIEYYFIGGGGAVALALRNHSNNTTFYYVALRCGGGMDLDPFEKVKQLKNLLKLIGIAVFIGKAATANWVPVTAFRPFSANEIDCCTIDCVGGNVNAGPPIGVHSWEKVTLRDDADKFAQVIFSESSWWGMPGAGGHVSGGVLIRVW